VNVAEDPVPDLMGLAGLSVSYSHANYKTHPHSRKSAFCFDQINGCRG
jgi:hypothetical protein